ncbi:MAG: TRIC cation channel family protein [Coriobacteriaceae bacterium]|jgi:uncharacterized membrane protein YeiH|nr:TRIC cation channel family protein [Coriobacteriaceae bacterium]
MLEVVLTVPFWFELAAALTGGISGAMSAVRARCDIFGTVCIACTCGLFGGIMRDLLLQNYGIYAFQKPELILCCVIAGIIVFFLGKLISYLDPVVALLDNLSCGIWAVISVGKGLSAGLDIIPSIILGTITAIGGGVMRDVFMNKQPEAFQAGALYGSASLIGATAFAIMKSYHFIEHWSALTCVVLVLIVRYASLLLGWHTKPPTDYSDVITKTVAKPVKAVARKARKARGTGTTGTERTAARQKPCDSGESPGLQGQKRPQGEDKT